MYNFFGSHSFGKQQKKQVLQALDAGDTDRLLAILSTYEPNADSYNLIDQHEFHTLLTYAACRGHLGIVKMLIETFHVDPEKRDRREQMSPLMYAALYNEPNLDVVRYLREDCTVDVDCVDRQGHTAAQLAEQNENLGVFEYLSRPVPSSEEKADEVAATDLPALEDDDDAQRANDEEVEELRVRLVSMESALSEANKRSSRLIKENVAADETYKVIHDHVCQMESETKQLQKKLQDEEGRRGRMQRQWEAALSESQDEISRLRRKLVTNNSNESELEKLKEETSQMRRSLGLAHDQITLMKQQVEQRAAEADRTEAAHEAELAELRAALAEKDLEIGRERENARAKEVDKKESDGEDYDDDDFVVIEPPEESSRRAQ